MVEIRRAHTPETLGRLWGVSAATVRNLVRSKKLKAFRIGRQIRIRPEHVEEYETSTTTGGDFGTPLE
jgi:excisionase family DNA binding protein